MISHVLALVREWEWVLLCAVAVLECVILAHGLMERRERRHLLSEMESTRVELGRESYVAMKNGALTKARHYMYFVSESLNADLSRREAERVFRRYRQVPDLRCITGADPARLHDMWELHRHGVEVRVSPLVVASAFRFQLCDDREAVLGFPERGAEPGVKGIHISDPHFGRMLLKHFRAMWEEAMPWQEFARSFVSSVSGQEDHATLTDMLENWGVHPEEADEFRCAIDDRLLA